jgi:hypothetical protein
MLVRLVRPAACGALHGAQTMIALAMMPDTASTMLLTMAGFVAVTAALIVAIIALS